jgi:two-component system, response regulator FlrC
VRGDRRNAARGREKGAFCGAAASKPDKLERANGGTFLLDEVGDMPLSLQSKILRVLDEHRIQWVGERVRPRRIGGC